MTALVLQNERPESLDSCQQLEEATPSTCDTSTNDQEAEHQPPPHAEDHEQDIQVIVGNSRMAMDDVSLADQISEVTMRAGGKRFSVSEARRRLAMGDSEPNAGRVLHVAFRKGKVVGCCSSTVGWSGTRGGHWGALAVDPSAQGIGVGSALVDAAELRLIERGCDRVQIEYHYLKGDPESERLRSWYEGKLGFSGSGSGFRFCSKRLSFADVAARQKRRVSRQSEPCITNGRNRSSAQSTTSVDGLIENQVHASEQVYKDQVKKKSTCQCTIM